MVTKTFKKSERLHKKKSIQELFSKGSYFYLSHFKILYLKKDNLKTCQVLISVPKKHFKRAVDRNKIKRRIREAYRTLKIRPNNPQVMAFIYNDKAIQSYAEIKQRLEQAMLKINN